MTDIEWGAEIAVNGVRPEWLRDGQSLGNYQEWCKGGDRWISVTHSAWGWVNTIRLPANHPYYLATSRGFTYWPGGKSAPEDWDGGEVLWEDEMESKPINPNSNSFVGWKRTGPINFGHHIIGYHKRTEQPARVIAPELVERMVLFMRRLNADYSYQPDGRTHKEEARAILAELEPDPDLTLAKSIVGHAEAIALAIKAARENGRG